MAKTLATFDAATGDPRYVDEGHVRQVWRDGTRYMALVRSEAYPSRWTDERTVILAPGEGRRLYVRFNGAQPPR